jgi:hypothetical protein
METALKSMDLVATVICDKGAAVDARRSTPVGGTCERTGTIVRTAPRSPGTTIRFALDGSEPAETSEGCLPTTDLGQGFSLISPADDVVCSNSEAPIRNECRPGQPMRANVLRAGMSVFWTIKG